MSVAPEISLDTINDEVEGCLELAERYGWIISDISADEQFTVQMVSPVDGEAYLIEINFENYPEWPLAIEFIHCDSGQRGVKNAYPLSKNHGNFFHSRPCICHPCNRLAYAGYKNVHKEWNLAAWKQNPKIGTLTSLKAILLAIYNRIDNSDTYNGRMK